MDEKETPKEIEKEKPVDKQDEGVQPETTSELDRADAIAERQKRENDRREALLTREENLHARKMVGGQSEAGQEITRPKVETPKEYNDRIEKEINEGQHGE